MWRIPLRSVKHAIGSVLLASEDLLELRDAVAIFHASFHPTKGNTVDWSSTSVDGACLLADHLSYVLNTCRIES